MAFRAICPNCGVAYNFPDEWQGKYVSCNNCRQSFTVNASAGPAVLPVAPPQETWDRPRARAADRRRYDDDEDYPQRPRKKSGSTWLVLGLVFGGLLLCCGIGGGAFYFVFIHEIEEKVTEADRAIVVTGEQLAPMVPNFTPQPNLQTVRKVRHLDGTWEVISEYGDPDQAGDQDVYLNCTVTVDKSTDDAKGTFIGVTTGTKFGLAIGAAGELSQVERNDLFTAGDQSKCILLMKDRKPVGNIVSVRKGKRVFHLMVVGVYFDDSGALHELLDPYMQRLDSYNP